MENVQGRIAKRAYDLFVARGGQHGYHIADWLQAEKDIKAEQEKAAPQKAVKAMAPAAAKVVPAVASKKKAAPKKK